MIKRNSFIRGYYLLVKNWLFWKTVHIKRHFQSPETLEDWEAYESGYEDEDF